ncbi:MAG TPA: F390 synthetase-related protein [Ktedonobacterales bacterium]|jgi:phenylacetate-CoA ligase
MNTIASLGVIASHFVRARWRWRNLRGTSLELYQDYRAQQTVAYVNEHAPFYRAHWAGHDLRDWRALPTVDKRLMMEHFDTFNTRGINREAAMEVALRAEQSRDFRPTLNGFTIGLSSGTSGHRGLFVASDWEQAGWAGTLLSRALHRWPGRLRVAFFLRSNSNLYEQLGGLVIQFRYFDLMTPLDEAIAALNDFQPQIIVGPPSLLGFLAEARAQGKLKAAPERLISVAEVLEPQDQERIASIFAVPVHQIYQCTEGFLAMSCVEGALHIQEDIVALQFEPLSDASVSTPGTADSAPPASVSLESSASESPSAEGQSTNIPTERVTPIITDLWRKTQPIIRYRLNDVLQLDPQPCRCGSSFRVIRAIEGRADDLCYFDTQMGGERPFYPDSIRRMVLLASQAIADYQVFQEGRGHLRIHLVVTSGAAFDTVADEVRASVAATLAQYDCRPATVQIESGLVPVPPGAKRRRVRRLS